jgi:pyruvate formate lyase activating enzyme
MTNGIPITLARRGTVEQVPAWIEGHERVVLTISGGEPLMQHKFVLKLFDAAKEMGVHTAA